MAQKRVKLGVIGCGSIGTWLHLPVIAGLEDLIELVGVCDLNEKLAKQTGEKYKVPYYTDLEKFLEQDMEAVSILTYASTHHTIGYKAAKRGKHILVEKPISITLPCADMMLEVCKKSGVFLEVAENYPFMPWDSVVNQIACSGLLGKIASLQVRDDLNGFAIDLGVHRFCQLCEPVDSEVKQVTAMMYVPDYARPARPVTERSFGERFHGYAGIVLVEFTNKTRGIYECYPLDSAVAVWSPDYRRIFGAKGVLADDLWPNNLPSLAQGKNYLHFRVENKWQEIPIEWDWKIKNGKRNLEKLVVRLEPPVIWENNFLEYDIFTQKVEGGSDDSSIVWRIAEAEIYSRFAKAIRGGSKLAYGGDKGRRDLELCMAAYESARINQPISLPLREITEHEKVVHKDFQVRYGYDPLKMVL